MRVSMVAILLALGAAPLCARGDSIPSDIEAFNRSLSQATRAMDNTAMLSLWDEQGVSLLPETAPMNGKPAIKDFLERTMAGLSGAHMESFELQCHLVSLQRPLASEWCDEHQVVQFGDGRKPFVGRGKMLLVLRRGTDQHWRILSEMWNQGLPSGS